jgi:hypothetical protein
VVFKWLIIGYIHDGCNNRTKYKKEKQFLLFFGKARDASMRIATSKMALLVMLRRP